MYEALYVTRNLQPTTSLSYTQCILYILKCKVFTILQCCTFIRITCLHPLDLKLPKVHSVTITSGFVGTSPSADPSLEVSWSAVDDPAVSYVVRYILSQGTLTTPPTDARQVTTANLEVTLSDSLAANKRKSYTYYIWVAATSAGVPMGEYSDRTSGATLNSEQFYSMSQYFNICLIPPALTLHRSLVNCTSRIRLSYYNLCVKFS